MKTYRTVYGEQTAEQVLNQMLAQRTSMTDHLVRQDRVEWSRLTSAVRREASKRGLKVVTGTGREYGYGDRRNQKRMWVTTDGYTMAGV